MDEQKPPEVPKPKVPKERNRPRPNMWMIITFAVMAIFAASLFMNSSGISGAAVSTVSARQAAQDVMDFVNSELMEGGATAEFINVTEKSGLYLVTFKIGDVTYSTYASMDGEYIFPYAIEMATSNDVPFSHAPDTVPETDKDAPSK